MPGVLDGVRVLEWGTFHAGPGAGALLGDLGAEVIKIEEPGRGDPERAWMRLGDFSLELPGGSNALFEASNRNKKSLTLNLQQERGREVLCRLVGKSDVFLTNFRAAAVQRLGLDYPSLRRHNPRLIYASVSAYGREGPDRDQAGYDFHGQGRSGVMACTGEPGTPPFLVNAWLADQATAIMASYQVVLALLARERYGFGQEVQTSLLASGMALVYMNLTIASLLGRELPRHERSASVNPMRNYYQCGDGLWIIGANQPQERFWPPFCQVLGQEGLVQDPRFDTNEKRALNARELIAILDRAFLTRPREEWVRLFREEGLSFTPVQSALEVLQDPQVLANGYLQELEHPSLGRVKLPGFPITLERTPARTHAPAPRLGQHTEEVLREIGGYSLQEVQAMRGQGII